MAVTIIKEHKKTALAVATAVATAIVYWLAGDSVTDIINALKAAF